jgi:hypothetical protein|tara:strand:+ start:2399 stop:2971 length:573 start_codon:yes stop_codon:yes gene_type:complete
MIHTVYEIYKKENPKHNYIGIHSTDNIDDGYMGSGTAIKSAISKHGSDSFIKKILVIANDRDNAYRIEADLIESRNPYYNISPGGIGNGVGESHPSYGKSQNKGNKRPDVAVRNRTGFNKGKSKPKQSEIMKEISHFKELDVSGERNSRYRHDIDMDKVLQLVSEGYSVSKASKELGYPNSTVVRRLKKK